MHRHETSSSLGCLVLLDMHLDFLECSVTRFKPDIGRVCTKIGQVYSLRYHALSSRFLSDSFHFGYGAEGTTKNPTYLIMRISFI